MALAGLEHDERADAGRRHRVTAGQLGLALDNREPGALTYLMIAENLARLESEHDRSSVARVKNGRRANALGRVDLQQVPGLHASTIAPRRVSPESRDPALYTRAMPLAVDQLELGPIGTNTYLVRASLGAAEAVVVDPSGDAATIQAALGALGARCAAILVTHGHFDHIVSLADLAEETGAPVYAPGGERILIEEPAAFTPPGITVRGTAADVWLDGGETVDVAGISFAVTLVPGHSPGAPRLLRGRPSLLGRRAVRRLGRSHRPPRRRLGHARRRRSRRSSTLPAGHDRPSGPRPRDDARARSSPGTRSSPTSARRGRSSERQDRASARNARRRPRRDAALAARHG